MSFIFSLTVGVMLLASMPICAEVYFARISQQDHYSSRGHQLKKVEDILQQDRANYHRFFKRDREDISDNLFIC